MDFIKQLIRIRKAKGLTQKDLAELVCYSQTTVYYWERRSRSIRLDVLQHWAKALGYRVEIKLIKED